MILNIIWRYSVIKLIIFHQWCLLAWLLYLWLSCGSYASVQMKTALPGIHIHYHLILCIYKCCVVYFQEILKMMKHKWRERILLLLPTKILHLMRLPYRCYAGWIDNEWDETNFVKNTYTLSINQNIILILVIWDHPFPLFVQRNILVFIAPNCFLQCASEHLI